MKILRLGNLIVTTVLAALFVGFFFLALDPILKRVIVKGGEAVFGARVSVRSVQTKIFQGTISISGLTVASADEPMKNLFEAAQLDFQVLTKPLLEKKIVIEEASLSGLAFDTPRQTSGALPKKSQPPESKEQDSPMSEKMLQTWGTAQSLGMGNIGQSQNSTIANLENLKPENLASLKILDEGETRLTTIESTWKEKLASLKSSLDPEPIKKQIQEIKSSDSKDPAALAANLKKLKELKDELSNRQKTIANAKKQADQDFGSVKTVLEEAKQAKKKDLASLKSLSGIPNLDPQSISMALLGPVISKRVSSALGWVEMAKKFMPNPKKNTSKKDLASQKRGVNILFPKENSWPSFLWKHASISGQWPNESGVIDFSGEFQDLTFQPAQWGNPFQAHINGSSSASALEAHLNMDHRPPSDNDQLTVTLTGQPIRGLELGNPDDLAVVLNQGNADLHFKTRREDDEWNVDLSAQIKDAQMQPKSKMTGLLAQKLEQTIGGVNSFKIQATYEGKHPNMKFDLNSDLGSVIASSVKNMLQGEIDRQQKALEAKVDALYREKADALDKMIDQKKSEVLGPLAKYDSDVETLIKEASKNPQSSQTPVPTNLKDLKKLFK